MTLEAVFSQEDHRFMSLALQQARQAAALGEVPVGAVLVDQQGTVLASAGNRRESMADPTAHAEVLALRAATGPDNPGGWRLPNTQLYVTLEPCILCMGAILHARVSSVIYGARDAKTGAAHSLYRLGEDKRLNHQVDLAEGLMADESVALLRDFFSKLRSKAQ